MCKGVYQGKAGLLGNNMLVRKSLIFGGLLFGVHRAQSAHPVTMRWESERVSTVLSEKVSLGDLFYSHLLTG